MAKALGLLFFLAKIVSSKRNFSIMRLPHGMRDAYMRRKTRPLVNHKLSAGFLLTMIYFAKTNITHSSMAELRIDEGTGYKE